jgi:menaquinol-cytochrome c reductase iron-sulfur subunit
MEEVKSAHAEQDSSRRQFMIWATGILTALCGVIVGLPLVGSFIGPAFRRTESSWIRVADLGNLPAGEPVSLQVTDVQVDAYLRESMVRYLWAVKHNDAEVTVFSPICPHLGCRYNWNSANRHFECPCHGSVYAQDGKVLGGPAPRPLDTLATRIENGGLSVKWQQFRSGVAEKIPV